MTLIDTAEMYGGGAAETLVGEAVAGQRDDVFLVSKAYPQNASRDRLRRACEASLKRLETDRLDLYLLHWRGSVPLAETVEAMERLKASGHIRQWGVSNLDADDMDELIVAGGEGCATDQVLYNLVRRGPEHTLLPWLERHQISTMAYSPVEQGKLLRNGALGTIAARLEVTPTQVALAWVMRRDGVIAIPRRELSSMSWRTGRRQTSCCRQPISPPSTRAFRRPGQLRGSRCFDTRRLQFAPRPTGSSRQLPA